MVEVGIDPEVGFCVIEEQSKKNDHTLDEFLAVLAKTDGFTRVDHWYCDVMMFLLEPIEWKILSFLIRRVVGFNKDNAEYDFRDHISVSQFTEGIKNTRTGAMLGFGTGLGKGTVEKYLKILQSFGIVEKTARSNPKLKNGDEYRLQPDRDKIDWRGLVERYQERKQADRNRMAKPREAEGFKE